MQIDNVNLELHRDGTTAKLVLKAKPFSHETPITFEELQCLALYLAHEVGVWRDDRIETDSNTLT